MRKGTVAAADNGSDTRARILATASELFYREGTRAVGVDLIVARSGVAKTSLYRHFRNKDELIAAFLLKEDADFWREWDAVAAAHVNASKEELDAQLTWIGERIARAGYRGCPQINIAAEYSNEEHPARKVAAAHKGELRKKLTSLARAIGLADPQSFGLQMAIVIDGALSSGRALHNVGPVRFLHMTADAFLATAALRKTRSRAPKH